MDEINVNKRGLRLPTAPVDMAVYDRNGMISYLMIISSCIC